MDGLIDGQLLFRMPTVREQAVGRAAGDCRLNAQQRVQRRYRPIGSASKPDSGGSQRAKRIGQTAAFRSDAPFAQPPSSMMCAGWTEAIIPSSAIR